MARRIVFMDPSYAEFEGDKLFNLADPVLNRDDQLLPFSRMRGACLHEGDLVHTADFLEQRPASGEHCDYYSIGMLRDYDSEAFGGVSLRAFVIMEPPLVMPQLYAALPRLTRLFDAVYLHNTHGFGYDMAGVDAGRLRRFFWPLPHADVDPALWSRRDRLDKLVVINGKHLPRGMHGELYGTRIEAMLALGPDRVDLYGNGWDRWRDRRHLWRPSYWATRRRIGSIYRGRCASKFEVLSRYAFCLCFENMAMPGYITEKIFDCFRAGTIPVYLGAPDIGVHVPAAAFVDARSHANWDGLHRYLRGLDSGRIEAMREAGKAFLRGARAQPYYTSLNDIVGVGETSRATRSA